MGIYKIGKLKIEPILLVNEGVEVSPNYIITTNLDLGVYNDITSIENWDIYGMLYLGDLMVIRNELTTLINQIGWGNLNGVEKLIGVKYFVVTKEKRDEVLREIIQKAQFSRNGLQVARKIKLPFNRLPSNDNYRVTDYSDELKFVYNEESLGIYLNEAGNLIQIDRSTLKDMHNFLFKFD